MFASLNPLLYVTVSPERLAIRNVRTGETSVELPDVALSRSTPRKIVCIGEDARRVATLRPADVVNPFLHPRTLISDLNIAGVFLRHQVKKLLGKRFVISSISMIMHPLGSPEGDFTQIELRALRDLALSAGASKVYLKRGGLLTEDEIKKLAEKGFRW